MQATIDAIALPWSAQIGLSVGHVVCPALLWIFELRPSPRRLICALSMVRWFCGAQRIFQPAINMTASFSDGELHRDPTIRLSKMLTRI